MQASMQCCLLATENNCCTVNTKFTYLLPLNTLTSYSHHCHFAVHCFSQHHARPPPPTLHCVELSLSRFTYLLFSYSPTVFCAILLCVDCSWWTRRCWQWPAAWVSWGSAIGIPQSVPAGLRNWAAMDWCQLTGWTWEQQIQQQQCKEWQPQQRRWRFGLWWWVGIAFAARRWHCNWGKWRRFGCCISKTKRERITSSPVQGFSNILVSLHFYGDNSHLHLTTLTHFLSLLHIFLLVVCWFFRFFRLQGFITILPDTVRFLHARYFATRYAELRLKDKFYLFLCELENPTDLLSTEILQCKWKAHIVVLVGRAILY